VTKKTSFLRVKKISGQISMEVPQKLKTDPPHDPAIPLLGTYSKESRSAYSRDTCTPMFIAALFKIAKLWK
jgi:hypothetical protein